MKWHMIRNLQRERIVVVLLLERLQHQNTKLEGASYSPGSKRDFCLSSFFKLCSIKREILSSKKLPRSAQRLWAVQPFDKGAQIFLHRQVVLHSLVTTSEACSAKGSWEKKGKTLQTQELEWIHHETQKVLSCSPKILRPPGKYWMWIQCEHQMVFFRVWWPWWSVWMKS